MKTIEVFKTNITQASIANDVVESLLEILPQCKINFDLHDCDNILRIESVEMLNTEDVKVHLEKIGFRAELLD
ncbi:MAG: hypothetical protein H7Y86_17015 [Rhizobacter sp.]|nr:hypothetical protein [Ferruginibacter sp.]